jgi:hypothetical protein
MFNIVSGATHRRFNSHINHAAYANRFDYGYHFDMKPRTLATLYDHKLYSILDCPVDGSWHFWLDDDTFFCQFDRPFTRLALPFDDEALLIFPRSPVTPLGLWTYISAGNFFFRSVPRVHEFFRSVLHQDIETVRRWWVPEDYGYFSEGDQDRMVYRLELDREINRYTEIVPWHIFNYRPYHFEHFAAEHFLVHINEPSRTKAAALSNFQKRFGFRDDTLVPSQISCDYLV